MNPSLFADRRDYIKYSIIRHLLQQKVRCTICWMMTMEVHDNPAHGYVNNPDQWQHYDPAVFNFLAHQIGLGPPPNMRSLADTQNSPIAACTFHWDLLPIGPQANRPGYFDNCINISGSSQLIFVDPDNGSPRRLTPIPPGEIHKYIQWEEIACIYQQCFSVLIYHHLQQNADLIPQDIAHAHDRLGADLNAATITTLRYNDIAFHFATQPAHTKRINQAITAITADWDDQVKVIR